MEGNKTIWSVGGGKGGVGKSVVTANIGCALAKAGKEVMLVDADLGGANLHTYFGIKYPPRGLDDFIKGRIASLDETAIPTPLPNLRLICAAGEFVGIANPAYAQKQKLIKHIRALKADHIIVDLGAGSTYNVLDFFAISNEGIIVMAPEPASIQNAYVFLKSFVYRRVMRLFADDPVITGVIKEATDSRSRNSVKSFSDLCERVSRQDMDAAHRALSEIKSYRPRLLLNMAVSKDDLRVIDAFKSAAKAFLSIEAAPAGVIYSNPSIKAAARRMRPFMLDESATDAHRDMNAIVANLLAPQPDEEAAGLAQAGVAAAPQPAASEKREVFGYNDNVVHNGAVHHVQTEVQGGSNPVIETVVYNGGRIFFSKRTLWRDVGGNGAGGSLRDFARKQHCAAMAAIKMDKIVIQG